MIATGLLAGLFYAYACSVMPGLTRAEDRSFVDAMQQINEAIENPVFFLSFFGAPLFTLVAAILEWRSEAKRAARWIAAAFALSLVALVVTAAFNIPLNNELADAGDPSRIDDLAAVLDRFENEWVAWNIVRTLATTAALGCLGRALVLHGRGT